MDLVLGLDADGGAWPPTTDGSTAQAGGAVVGPLGLLRIVETALGLGGPAIPSLRRIACWRAKLGAADGPARFWHESFARDPLATARLTLGWRDALVDAGWSQAALPTPPKRLGDLADAEAAGPPLPPGPEDRLRRAIRSLRDDPPPEPPVARLRLLDDRGLLPPALGALVQALEEVGVEIRQEPLPDPSAAGDDLGAIQAKLLAPASRSPLRGDGSFTLLTARTEAAAAELVADVLAQAARHDGTVLLATRPTPLLDAALRRRHLPRIGRHARSPFRGSVQLLPLMLATRWRPFDAARMLELAQRSSPIPREVRGRLAELLPKRPGRGGNGWRLAVDDGLREAEARIGAETPPDSSPGPAIAAARAAVRLWLDAPPFDPKVGIPKADLRALLSNLAAWARARAKRDPLMAELAACCTALDEAVLESTLASLPRREVERLLQMLQEEGCAHPEPSEEAAPWGVAGAAGGVWGRPETVVWWGFDPVAPPARLPWSTEELLALEAAGCPPWRPEARLAAEAAAARRPVLGARRAVLLVAVGDEERHGLADAIGPLPPSVERCAEALLVEQAPVLGGVALGRIAAPPLTMPAPRPQWQAGGPVSVARASDSATAVEKLLGCPLSWALSYRTGLRLGSLAELDAPEALTGTLAHLLAEELFPPGAPPSPAAAEAAARARLHLLLEEAGAPLLMAGHARELAALRHGLPLAMRFLAALLRAEGLRVEALEASVDAPDALGPGEALGGSVDMLLRDAADRPVVLDLKWTARGKAYRDRLLKGRAIQLAAYAQASGADEQAAYVLLRSREAPGAKWGPSQVGGAPGLADTWQGTLASRSAFAGLMAQGDLLARGLLEPEDKKDPARKKGDPPGLDVAVDAPCRFCSAGRICGKEALA